jgi:hypothetical protein
MEISPTVDQALLDLQSDRITLQKALVDLNLVLNADKKHIYCSLVLTKMFQMDYIVIHWLGLPLIGFLPTNIWAFG